MKDPAPRRKSGPRRGSVWVCRAAFSRVVGPRGRRARPPGASQFSGLRGVISYDNDAKGGRGRMRRILLLAAALAAFTVVGIAAAGKPATVSISAVRPAVTFGSSVKLSGTVSNHQAGEHVLILARPYGQTDSTEVASTDTTAKGAWS